MPRLPVVGYVRRTSRAKATTPGFATGSHETCGRYSDNFSIFFGSATGADGTRTWAPARRATGVASTSALVATVAAIRRGRREPVLVHIRPAPPSPSGTRRVGGKATGTPTQRHTAGRDRTQVD